MVHAVDLKLFFIFFDTFINNSRSKQNKKRPELALVENVENVFKISAKKILNSMVVRACQSIQFFRQKPLYCPYQTAFGHQTWQDDNLV